MAIDKIRGFYGAKYAIPYAPATRIPYGVFRVMSEINFERKIEYTDLMGGDAAGAWDSEMGQPENTLSMTIKEYPNFAYQLLEGATVTGTPTTAEAAGYASAITNKSGTSVVSATTGIASVAIKSAKKANLPYGTVVLTALSADTVSVKVLGLPKGDGSFLSSDGTVVATVTIPVGSGSVGGTVDVESIGITITSGTSVSARTMVTGDTATFDTRPVNNGHSIIEVGKSTATINEFGMIVVMPQKSDGMIFYHDIFRIKAAGMPWSAKSRDWSEWQMSGKVIVDSTQDAIYKSYMISPNA